MPKLNREQRFAVLKNIFEELGSKSALRQAARLQIPADDARELISEWSGEPAEEAPAPRRARIERGAVTGRVTRSEPTSTERATRVTREPERGPRPVTAKKPVKLKIGEASLPKEKEQGDDYVEGHKGAKLFKGTHVRYAGNGGGVAVGCIITLGKQQSEVKWFRTGATQAEVNTHLSRAYKNGN